MPDGGAPEIEHVLDPDTRRIVGYYEGLSPKRRTIAEELLRDLRVAEQQEAIGGTGEPREE